jgi:hypothetical protein
VYWYETPWENNILTCKHKPRSVLAIHLLDMFFTKMTYTHNHKHINMWERSSDDNCECSHTSLVEMEKCTHSCQACWVCSQWQGKKKKKCSLLLIGGILSPWKWTKSYTRKFMFPFLCFMRQVSVCTAWKKKALAEYIHFSHWWTSQYIA